MWFFIFFLSASFAGPKAKLPAQRLAVDDGGALQLPEISIAVVGNTRPTSPMLDKRKAISGGASDLILGDITARGVLDPMTFMVHLGDMVSASTASAWRGFGKQYAAIIDGDTAPPTAIRRMPIVPVVGDRDCAKEPSCETLAKVFPGFGQEIGYGRVATWQSFDLVVGDGERWRAVVLDSNKEGLGSRWREQLVWLRDAVTDPGKGLIVFIHESPLSRSKNKKAEGATELMDLVAGAAPLLSIRAVFSAGTANTQVFLPEGGLGPLHVVAGGGGAPADDLTRGLKGRSDEPVLDPRFDAAVDSLVESYAGLEKAPSQKALDEALGSGTFDGYPRVVDAGEFPTYGWWAVTLKAGSLGVEWRALQGTGALANSAQWTWTADTGWKAQ